MRPKSCFAVQDRAGGAFAPAASPAAPRRTPAPRRRRPAPAPRAARCAPRRCGPSRPGSGPAASCPRTTCSFSSDSRQAASASAARSAREQRRRALQVELGGGAVAGDAGRQRRRVPLHGRVDGGEVVAVERARRHQLQAHVVVGVERRAAGEGLRAGLVEAQLHQQVEGKLDARARGRLVATPRFDSWACMRARSKRKGRREPSSSRSRSPKTSVCGKTLRNVATSERGALLRHAVEVEPLAHHAVRREPRREAREEVGGEQVGHAGEPGVRRLRDDEVVGSAAAQVGARVAQDELHARVLERKAVLGLEEARGFHHRRLDLERVDRLHGMGQHGAHRHAAAPADDGHAAGVRRP